MNRQAQKRKSRYQLFLAICVSLVVLGLLQSVPQSVLSAITPATILAFLFLSGFCAAGVYILWRVTGGVRQREELHRWLGGAEQQREEEHRQRIEAMLHRDAVRDEINYMSGPAFEKFMADVFRQKGYGVEETPLSGDQGVDLVLPDLDGKRVVVQLKRWTGPVGNKAVQATFAGMAHYHANEGWIITTSTFTKSARELARSTSVRLIDGKELADWLDGLSEAE